MNTVRDPDAVLGAWLDDGPQTLPDETRQAIAVGIRTVTRRRSGIGWRFARVGLPTIDVRRLSVAVGTATVVVVAAAVALNLYRSQVGVGGPPSLPTTPDAWERVLIETPSGTAEASVISLAASQSGLLAVLGEAGQYPDETRLAVSADGRGWTLVPVGRHPSLTSPRTFGYPAVAGTDRGFLLLQLNEVWASENGYDWRRLASPATDPDLRLGGPGAATAGGPGLVAVGGERAWYSADGSDWSVAAVPALPEEILARPDSERYVEMTGVTAAGNDLVAWGIAEVPLADNSDEHLVVPLLWASHDGLTWASVVDRLMDSVSAVTGGPGGFVAAGRAGSEAAVWFSPDGAAWDRVSDGAFTSHWSKDSEGTLVNDEGMPVKLMLKSTAATSAGYVVVGGDGLCLLGPCPDQEAVIWTSTDGSSWSRLPSDGLFSRAWANKAVAWGSRFVVGGVYDGQPVIWISDSEQSGSGAKASTAPAPTIPTRAPGQPISFAESWEATDIDGSHQTMEAIERPNGSYDVTIRDDIAKVCGGVSFTMTGVAEATDPGTFVMEQPEYVCDDGSQPRTTSGLPLDEQLRSLSFYYDSLRDALFDSFGVEWTR